MAKSSNSQEEQASSCFNLQEETEHCQFSATHPATLKLNSVFQERSSSQEEEASPSFDLQEELGHLKFLATHPATLRLNRYFQKSVRGPWLDWLAVYFVIMFLVTRTTYTPCRPVPLRMRVTEAVTLMFFLCESSFKILFLGFYGTEGSYLRSTLNKIEYLIFWTEFLEYVLRSTLPVWNGLSIALVLKAVRLITRVKSVQALVFMLAKILPAVVKCFLCLALLTYVFALPAVQLWSGDLHNRCFLGVNLSELYNISMSPYYQPTPDDEEPFICSAHGFGMRHCHEVPPLFDREGICSVAPAIFAGNWTAPTVSGFNMSQCVNWNLLFNTCLPLGPNPGMGVISYDHIGHAWITTFQVLTLEGWGDIMFSVMDASSFWSLLYFLFLAVVGSFITWKTCTFFIVSKFMVSLDLYRSQHSPTTRTSRNMFMTLINNLRARQESREDSASCDGVFWILSPYRRKLKDCVAGQVLSCLKNLVIVFSLLAMSIEHHNQPETLAQALYACNIISTTFFIIEMVLKVLASPFGYVLDLNNILDLTIIVTSLVELRSGAQSRLSFFRALRFWHLVKLVRHIPDMKKQVSVLKGVMEQSRPLLVLVFVVIVSFSALSMQLFACKVNTTDFDERQNYGTVLWSMVTNFETLTLDNWNNRMYNAVAATNPWAVLYFVVYVFLSSYVLPSVLVGFAMDPISFLAERPSSSVAENGSGSSPADPNPSQQDAPEQTETTQDERPMNWIQTVLHWCKEHEDWSHYILSPQNRFRRFCQTLIDHRVFKGIMVFIDLLTCLVFIFEKPGIHPNSVEQWLLNVVHISTTVFFTVEMFLKVIALGLIIGKHSYGRSLLNWIDGVVTITSVVDIILLQLSRGTSVPRVFRFLRLLRLFKLLKLSKHVKACTVTSKVLITSAKPLAIILLVAFLIFFFYSLVGMQLFMGMFHHCVGVDFVNMANIINKTDCLAAGYQWVPEDFSFDSLPLALMALFVMYYKDGWLNIMHSGLDAVGVNMQPVRNKSLWTMPYFLSFEIMSFFLEDIFTAVIVEAFVKEKTAEYMSLLKRGLVQNNTTTHQTNKQFYQSLSAHRRRVYNLCNILDRCFPIIIVINLVIMGFEHHNQPEHISKMLEYSFNVFTILLMIEVLLKIIAFGIWRFLRDGWNLLDLAILLASFLSIFLSQVLKRQVIPINLSLLRACRILRLHQLLKAGTVRTLLRSMWTTLKQIASIGALFVVIFFIYAALGVELFGTLECTLQNPCEGLNRYSNFRHFGLAMITLFRIFTGDNWSGVLKIFFREQGNSLRSCRPDDSICLMDWAGTAYFLTFMVITQLLLWNVIAYVIILTLLLPPKITKVSDNTVTMVGTRFPEPQSTGSGLPDVQEPENHQNGGTKPLELPPVEV